LNWNQRFGRRLGSLNAKTSDAIILAKGNVSRTVHHVGFSADFHDGFMTERKPGVAYQPSENCFLPSYTFSYRYFLQRSGLLRIAPEHR
jgi:hypothetical protein